jgi:meso-butanediol dehydrogenase/(S,S)-butanediol dehydrogenase/diacetyl reductase
MITIDLSGKAAFVTGAADGLGAACARKLAETGANVVLADIQYEKVQRQAEGIRADFGVESAAVGLDVTKWGDVEAAVASAAEKFGHLDIMVNCAGIGMMKPFDEYTQEDVDRIFDINAKGVWYGCSAAAKIMLKQKSGVILNFTSIAARQGKATVEVYAGSKAAVCAFTQGLGRQFAAENVRVNAIMPGYVRTPMMERDLDLWTNNGTQEEKDLLYAEYLKQAAIPMGRNQQPEDVANVLVFLASDLASNITAQVFCIDGGSTISY